MRCAVVTGANKGIGLEICRKLALQGITVILSSRDEKKGTEAVEKLKQTAGPSQVVFHQLDVRDPISIRSLQDFIRTHFKKLDILVNNAGDSGLLIVNEEAFRAVTFPGGELKDEDTNKLKGMLEETYERAQECLQTNFYGAKYVTEALLPLLHLSSSARIVNISSIYGQLKFISSEKIKENLNNVDDLTTERIDELLRWFLNDFKEGNLEVNGWPLTVSAYKVSKAALNAYTRILARKLPACFLVNCVHPGLVKTDLSYGRGILTPEEGANGPVMLALLPDNGPSGMYFDQMELSKF